MQLSRKPYPRDGAAANQNSSAAGGAFRRRSQRCQRRNAHSITDVVLVQRLLNHALAYNAHNQTLPHISPPVHTTAPAVWTAMSPIPHHHKSVQVSITSGLHDVPKVSSNTHQYDTHRSPIASTLICPPSPTQSHDHAVRTGTAVFGMTRRDMAEMAPPLRRCARQGFSRICSSPSKTARWSALATPALPTVHGAATGSRPRTRSTSLSRPAGHRDGRRLLPALLDRCESLGLRLVVAVIGGTAIPTRCQHSDYALKLQLHPCRVSCLASVGSSTAGSVRCSWFARLAPAPLAPPAPGA